MVNFLSFQPSAASATLVNVDELQRPLEVNLVNVTHNQEPRYCGCPCPSPTVAGVEAVQLPAPPPLESMPTETSQYVNGDVVQSECINSATKEHDYINTVVCSKRLPSTSSPPPANTTVVGSEHEYMNTGILAEGGATSLEPVSSRFGDVNANTTTKTKNDELESSPPVYYNMPSIASSSRGSFSGPLAIHPETIPHSNSLIYKKTKLCKNIHVNGTKLMRDPFYLNVTPAGPSTSLSPPKIGAKKTVHYAVLDLNGIEISVADNETPDDAERDGASDASDDGNNGKGYVTIDFDKTAALLSSTTNRQKQTVEILKKTQSDSLSK